MPSSNPFPRAPEPDVPRIMTAGGQHPLQGPPGSETRAVPPDQGERARTQGDDRGPPCALPGHELGSGPRVSRADRSCGNAGEGFAIGEQRGEACDADELACVRPSSLRGDGQGVRGVRFASEISYFPPPVPLASDPPLRTNRFAVLQVEEAAEGAKSTEQGQSGPGLGGAPADGFRAPGAGEGELSGGQVIAAEPPPSSRMHGYGTHTFEQAGAANSILLPKGGLSIEVGDAPSVAVEFGSSYRRRKRRKLRGALGAHALFLQYIFRRSTALRPGCWRRGGLVGLIIRRPVTTFACRGGMNNAPHLAFEDQRLRGLAACGWYENYARLLQKLSSGAAPTALVTFCGQGGVSEGIRQGGGSSHGQDLHPQPAYVARFGGTTFTQGDSTGMTGVADLRRRARAFITMASPPCKPYSGARMRGAPKEEPMIAQTRDVLRQAGGLYAIENVVGAKTDLRAGACQLRGSMFGLHVDRPRLFETNFELQVDEALAEPGRALRCGCCMGFRRRVARLDPFGRPELRDCCSGNLWAPQGDKPFRCTTQECSLAMGMDVDHMSYEGLAQAIPPVYSRYIFGQACMREVERRFGIEAITYDQMLADPARAERLMAHWLRGAGGASPDQGVEFVGSATSRLPQPSAPPSDEAAAAMGADGAAAPTYQPLFHGGDEDRVAPASWPTVVEAELREAAYSWAGDFDVLVGGAQVRGALGPLRSASVVASCDWAGPAPGVNTFAWVSSSAIYDGAEDWAATAQEHPGTRACVVARGWREEAFLKACGFILLRRVRGGEPTYATEGASARLPSPFSFWTIGRVVLEGGEAVDYARVEEHMDPQDRSGAVTEPKSAKAARSYMPIPWDKERWDVGLPAELDLIMARRGVGIYPVEELGPSEVPFYPWANNEGLMRSIAEADRALLAGAMEYVPAHRLEEVLGCSTIHPWTIVDQGGGKWRLCHDYSVGINKQVPTASFVLPTVWDAARVIKPSSFFAKYDIRDGFWHMPIGDDSRKRLVVRHPGTGRLMWASRLPFGYLEAPRLFCGLTEAVIERLRQKAAGRGIHFLVFVDDVLVVGDTEELTREGMRLLEEEFAARGIQWAPHKRRGPCRSIEFLGLLLCNFEGMRGVTLSQKRRGKLMAELNGWKERRPSEGTLKADPRELASTLGKLIFASQVVKGGRTYMQGMLSQFKGLVVDWRRGTVAPVGGAWHELEVTDGFWRDLDWWLDHLHSRSLAPFESEKPMGEAVVTGTDASGWGTGQVLWLDGAREESVVRFTAAEKRRPINWRELLGILRVCETGGERFRGKTVLIETDNMAAKGATRKMASKAADMQELVRRLYRSAEKFGFSIRVMHTPGEKLDRPDQTSRGDAVEEPRARLRASVFNDIERRWGPFSDFIGAEREIAQRVELSASTGRRLWAHPTYGTVGSALRRIQEQMANGGVSTGMRALAMVPDDDRPAWFKMMRHGRVIARWGEGEPVLDINTLGAWHPGLTKRPMCLVVFPRADGAVPRRVGISHREGMELEPGSPRDSADGWVDVHTPPEGGAIMPSPRRVRAAGYQVADDGSMLVLPVLAGSFAYHLPKEDGQPGGLYQILTPSHDEVLSHPGGIIGIWAYIDGGRAVRQLSKLPVWTVKTTGERYAPDPRELWTVDHLVTPLKGSAAGTLKRYSFDWREANRQIGQAGGVWRPSDAGWEGVGSAEEEVTPTQAGPFQRIKKVCQCPVTNCQTEPFDDDPYCDDCDPCGATQGNHGCRCRSQNCEGRYCDGVYNDKALATPAPQTRATRSSFSGGVDTPSSLGTYVPFGAAGVPSGGVGEAPPAESLPEVQEALAGLHLAQHALKTGPQGAVAPREFAARGGEREGATGVVRQPCRYAEQKCGGCDVRFALGERMESRGAGFCHLNDECRSRVDEITAVLAAESGEAAARPVTFYGVFSPEVGESGVYTTWPEVASLLGDEAAAANVQWAAFQTHRDALTFVKERTAAAATEAASAPGPKGSLSRRTHFMEKVSEARLGQIERCIQGQCGVAHTLANATACKGGCGRFLHMVQCAEMGKGYAALGNFLCTECRLQEISTDVTAVTAEQRRTLSITMVLELTQGSETTAAGFADYESLESRYVMGMGTVLDGGGRERPVLRLPRHNAECFKNFLTWLATDAERVRSMEGTVRVAGLMMVKLGVPDVTKDGSVKAHMKELLQDISIEHEPATAATAKMLKEIALPGGVIDKRFKSTVVAGRTKVQFVFEAVGGCRIGEVCGAGEGHGLLANNTAILEDLDAPPGDLLKVVVEAKLEHSKTGFSRYLDLAGVTGESQIPCAKILADYWRLAGMQTVTYMQAGVRVTRPDFWVVRVSLQGLKGPGVDGVTRLQDFLRSHASPLVKRALSSKLTDLRTRAGAFGASSQEKRFINIASGPLGSFVHCRDLPTTDRAEEMVDIIGASGGGRATNPLIVIRDEVLAAGFEASIVEGPLLLATTGGNKPALKDMPLGTGSGGDPMKELLTQAAFNLKGRDEELDVEAGREARWSSHSLRRLADTTARRFRVDMDVTEAEIDLYFGWHEKVLLKEMQRHYAAMIIRERMKQARITGMM